MRSLAGKFPPGSAILVRVSPFLTQKATLETHSHTYLDGSSDILVVGGYPDGRDQGLLRDEHASEADWREAIQRIMPLPVLELDPVTGESMQQWREVPSSVEWGATKMLTCSKKSD